MIFNKGNNCVIAYGQKNRSDKDVRVTIGEKGDGMIDKA